MATLFGEDLHRSFEKAAERVELVFAGIVARPLYKCTERLSTGEVCMKVASMSPFLQCSAGRREYKCMDCMAQAENAQVASGSASAALRCLHAYPTVEGGDGRPTLLRTEGPRRLLVHAPPDTWGWRRPKDERPIDGPAARPQRGYPAKGWYN